MMIEYVLNKLTVCFAVFILHLSLLNQCYAQMDGAGLQKLPEYKERIKEFGQSAGEFLKNRVSIGTRIVHFELETEKDDYIGSVDNLDAKQNYDPTRIFIDILLKSYEKFNLEFELTWERLAMNTLTSTDGHNDGTLELSGPVFSFHGRYPNETRFTPYGGIGAVYFNRTHVTKGWWHHGFPFDSNNPQNSEQLYVDWLNSGAPSWPNNGYTRTFEIDETWGGLVTLGCAIELYERLEADLYFRYTNATVDGTFILARYYNPPDRVDEIEFDVNNFAYGIGIKYKF